MRQRVSRARWILLAVSGLLCVGALLVRRQFPPGRLGGEPELAALRTEKSLLADCDDQSRDHWKRRAEASQASPWDEGDLHRLEIRIGSGWRRTVATVEPGARFLRVEFSREAAPLGEWPAFIRLVEELEQQPGLSFAAIELAAGGTSRRRFTRMAFAVHVAWTASSGNAERAASLVPLPVSPPSLPAPRRRAGAIPSLRRPAAVGNVPSSAPGAGKNINPEKPRS